MENSLSDGRPQLAAKLGAGHSDVRVRAGNQKGDLHDQRHRILEYDIAKNHQKSGDVPK